LIRRVNTNNRIISIGIICLLVFGGFVGFVNFGSEKAQGTNVSGPIVIDTIWDLGGSPYIVTGDVTVLSGVTLTIEPGVIVKFDGFYSISVNGTLIAIGTETDRINITSNNLTPNPGNWFRIQINSNGHAEVKYCNITYGGHGIYLSGSSYNNITDNDILYNIEGIQLTSSSYNNITGNYFSYNNKGIYLISSSNNNISNNNMSLNSLFGIYLFSSPNNNITNNVILSNVKSGIDLEISSNNNIINNIISLHNVSGISLSSSANNNITNNIISNNNDGIYVDGSSNIVILNNNISSNTWNGIFMKGVSNSIIANNYFSTNGDTAYTGCGIWLQISTNITVVNNNFINDGINIYKGGTLSNFTTHTIPVNNLVNGKPLYYYKNINDFSVDGIILGQLILANCSNVDVTNLYISNTETGILAAYCNDILVTKNNLTSIKGGGIELYRSSKSNITYNNISFDRWDGIGLSFSSENQILNNYITRSKYGKGFSTGGIIIWALSNHNIVKNNIVLFNSFTPSFFYGSYGGIIVHGSNNTITANICSYNTRGIHVYSYSDNNINNNDVSDNLYGIVLLYTSNNNITNNDFTNNEVAIYFRYRKPDMVSEGNTITYNQVSDNDKGFDIEFGGSQNNSIHHNNIVNNTIQAIDNTTNGNQWDNGYPSGGNYWSDFDDSGDGAYDDYIGPNQDVPGSDGIVDNGTIGGGGKNPYWIDMDSKDVYPLINPIDTSPPIITNLQPPDASITNNSTLMIGADYSDPSGINVGSVVLMVDGIDVTSSAVVTASGVSYTPVTALSDGIHTVYLEVKDNVGNLAIVTWSFTVDTSPPTITNLRPPDASSTNNNTPMIGADYSDLSGIDVSSVLLKVDGIDVTFSATITIGSVSFIPGMILPDGIHTVYLEVRDNAGNLATVMWSFIVDSTPPIITDLHPPDGSITNDNTPNINANYSDSSGINASSVLLEVDGIDITLSAVVTAIGVSYIPGTVLSDNLHTVYLEVKDIYGNLATVSWSFTVDTSPPTITNLRPPDLSTTNNSIPTISADYSDLSGINVSSVVLRVDGIDVTSSTTITASGVSYLPGATLSDSTHTVYLEVKDNVDNLESVTWSFTVDSTPPIITNLQPPDASTTNDNTTAIRADYSDSSGINVSSVMLKVDDIDVTPSATITASNVTYTPGIALSDDIHTIYLEVKDIYGNLAIATWSFTVDTTPPTTTISPNNYTVKLGTLFTLTATDGIAGCGVNYTQYKIDNGNWIDYLGPFFIDTYGYHNISYRSVDNLGNTENENTLSIYVPEVPITTLNIGIPQYGIAPRYVNQFTQFSFSVIDYSGTGYNTYYYIDASPPIPYTGAFTVSTEGAHTIYYYSTDNLGNIEETKEFDIIVDNTPPTTNITIGDPNYVSGDTWVTSDTLFTIDATDVGLIPVGLNYTKYRIWNGGVWTSWTTYTDGFSLGTNEGTCYVEFYSID